MHPVFFRRFSLAWLCLLLAFPAAARELLAVGTGFPGVFEHGAPGD